MLLIVARPSALCLMLCSVRHVHNHQYRQTMTDIFSRAVSHVLLVIFRDLVLVFFFRSVYRPNSYFYSSSSLHTADSKVV